MHHVISFGLVSYCAKKEIKTIEDREFPRKI